MKYKITRILGNELPPRDLPGSSLKTLEYILNNEPKFPDCDKLWLINQIHNKRDKVKKIRKLEENNAIYHVIEFNKTEYWSKKTLDEKVCHAININGARNQAIDFGKESEFVFVLDGDCFFTQETWNLTTEQLEKDQHENPHRTVYGIPAVRSMEGNIINPNEISKCEPMLVFRHDSHYKFDESIPFGKNDKIDLLRRIGYNCKKGQVIPAGEICKNIGYLIHVSFSERNIETDMLLRMLLRDESVNRLIQSLDTIPFT